MKQLMILFAISMVTMLHAKTFDSAIEYNNFLINEQKAVITKISDVTNALLAEDFKANAVWKAHKTLEKQCNKSVKAVETADAYAGGVDFKKSMLDLLLCYQEFANNGFKEVCTIYCKDTKSDEEIKKIGEVLDMFDLMEQLNLILFEYAQADYANANNFTVAKN
jgi:hypothetical protein